MQPPLTEPQQKALINRLRHQSAPKPTFAEKAHHLKVAARASNSLAVMTTATRDAVEAEMAARRSADANRAEYEASAATVLSPAPLDSQP